MREAALELLQRPRRIEEALALAHMETVEALERCRRTTGHYGAEGRARGWGGPRDGEYVRLCDLAEEEERLRRCLAAAEKEVDALLSAVRQESFRDHCVLHRRYCRGQSWQQVRGGLQETFGIAITLRTVHNWHRAALERAGRLMEKR